LKWECKAYTPSSNLLAFAFLYLQDFEQYMFDKLEKATAKSPPSTNKSNFATITRWDWEVVGHNVEMKLGL